MKNFYPMATRLFVVLITTVFVSTLGYSQVSGTVFRDYNANGTRQSTATFAEPALTGVIVNAYNASDVLIASYKTGTGGTYSIPATGTYNGTVGSNTGSVANGVAVRLEFVIPSTGTCLLDSLFDYSSNAGNVYGTSVRFVSGGATAVNYAINNPADYVKNTPSSLLDTMYVSRMISGNPAGGGTAGSRNAFYKFGYRNEGNTSSASSGVEPPGAVALATNAQIGSCYGVGYSPFANRVFTSAFMKRHAGFGPANGTFNNAPGAIYVINPNLTTASPAATYFASLDALGFPTHNSTGTPAYGSGTSYTTTVNGTNGYQARVTYPANGLGVIGTNANRILPAASTSTSSDPAALGQVGKVSLGDLEVSEDGKYVYVTNLFDRKLYKLTLNSAGAPTSVTATAGFTLPDPPLRSTSGITNAAATYTGANDNTAFYTGARGLQRPFAVAVNRGKVYVGAITTGEGTAGTTTLDNNTGNPEYTDLWAYVWEFNPATNSFVTTPVLQFPLNFNKGTNVDNTNESWKVWRDTIPNPWDNSPSASLEYVQYPHPIFSDIVFDTSNIMILGFRDRWGDMGAYDEPSVNGAGRIAAQSFGDLYRAYFNPTTCAFQLESNGKEGAASGKAATAGAGNANGPGGGEFYYRDHVYDANDGTPTFTFHLNTTMGALAIVKGSDTVTTTTMDPMRAWSGGISWFGNTGGDNGRDYEMYSGAGTGDFPTPPVGDFGKANGLGDLELLTYLPPIEIGNRVWNDLDGDGIQDPGEAGIANVTVNLYSNGVDGIPGTGDDVLVGTATTTPTGEYLFTNAAGTDGGGVDYGANIQANTAYNVRIAPSDWTPGSSSGTGDLASYKVTQTNTDGNGFNDGSDNDASLNLNAVPMINITTGNPGQNNHNVDFGFYQPASLGNKVWLDMGAGGGTANNGVQDGTEPGVAGVTVTLYDANNNVVGTTVTDAFGNYLFSNLAPGNYSVGFTLPANYTFTTQTNTADNENAGAATGSDVNITTGKSYSVNLSPGENELDIDAGIIFTTPPAVNSIGDKVWLDADGDGVQDGGAAEPGVAGVTVTLYAADGVTVVAVTTTDANGNYLFNNLPANTNYIVGFSAPAGTVLTSSAGTTPGTNTDSDANPATGKTAAVNTGAAGTATTGIDAGIKNDPKGSLGDFVWNDLDHDGIQDAGEPGIQGVTMQLYDPGPDGVIGGGDDILKATTTTDATGYYVFPNLDAGTYFVVATPPAGYTTSPANVTSPGGDTKDSDFGAGSAPYAGKQVSGLYNLPTAIGGLNKDMTVDLGLYNSTANLNSLGDKVWNDIDKDGIQDAGEAGVPNVTVRLLNSAGSPVNNPATGQPYVVTTDANGNYKFVDLPDGNYIVEFANIPAGYSFTGQDASGTGAPGSGTDGTTDSDANPVTGRTAVIDLDAAGANGTSVNLINVDAGISQGIPAGKGSLGDKVWYDLDNDGIQDAGEPGVAGVTVNLYKDTNGDGVISGAELTPFATTTTNALGEYMFGGLDAANYQVGFSTLPSGYTLSAKDQGTDDAVDSDGNPLNTAVNGNPAVAGTSFTNLVALAQGEDKLTVDLGIVPPAGTNTLGNKVWWDNGQGGGTASNGIQDGTEPGVQGVQATLLNADGSVYDKDPLTAGVQPYVTTTDENGNYLFVGLPDGQYQVAFSNFPAGFSLTTQDANAEATGTDSDPNAVSGITGIYDLDNAHASATGINETKVDAGLVSTRAALGDKVWLDTNGDGVQDAGEAGVPGVTVILYAADGTTVLASTITDANGNYLFPNLNAGSYVVGFSTIPSNLSFTQQNTPGDNQNNTNSDAIPATGKTGVIVLSAGEVDLTVDAGLRPNNPASVGDLVWYDLDKDGVQDANEPGVPGVLVTLYDASNNVVGTAITDGDGNYLISNIPPGNGYYIIFSNKPDGLAFTTQTSDVSTTDATLGSDANATTGQTAAFNLTAGQYLPHVDAGLVNPLASLGNKVWLDEGAGGGTRANGVQDGTEPGVAGVPVDLYQNGPDGLPGTSDDILIASTITDAYGIYNFNNLQPSTNAATQYNVRVTPPVNYSLTTQTNTTDDNNTTGASTTGSDVNPLGVSYSIALSAGENNPNIDAGLIFNAPPAVNSIGDKVWFDTDGDGVQDAGEPGVSGVTVTLYDAAGNIAAITTTDANGNYIFNNLPPNTNYTVGFSAPGGTVLTTSTGTTPGNATTNSDADPVTGRTATVNTGAAGTAITGIDAGIKNDPKGALGDYVWNDLNHDGIQDPGEAGVAGVTMTLYGPGPDGLIGGGDDILIATTTTDATGYYIFPNLDPANYFVVATPPAGYTRSPQYTAAGNPGGITTDSDFGDGAGPYAGSYVSGLKSLPTTTGGITRDMTVDLGIYNTTPNLNTLGDKVWNDVDKDGIQDAGEAGVPNVTVRLLDNVGNPVNNPATGDPYVVVTDANGNYKFVDLPDGEYMVEFANIPAGYSFTGQDASGSGAPGSGTDGTDDSDAGTVSGRTGIINIDAAGTNPATINITNVDAGISQGTPVGKASLGNRVWYDMDNNGLQDAGELGVSNVKVELLDGSGNPVNVPGTGTPYVVYTNALGEYIFTGLDAGDYQVRFSEFPSGYTSSTANVGANDAIDADANFSGNSNPATTATTGIYSLSEGEDNMTVDMGIVPPAGTNSLGNYVWNDLDSDGKQDAGEPGVQGVTVTLYGNGLDGLPGTADDIVLGTTTTDSLGRYQFVGLPDGNYNVGFSNLPAGFTFTTKDASGATAADGSDANKVSGRTGTVALDPTNSSATGINDPNVDAGIVTTRASLGNYVWLDTNGDGVQDATEAGVPGVTVILYAADGTTVLGSTITDANGKYLFPNLTPGNYVVGFSTIPGGLVFTQQNTPGDNQDNTNSDANPATGKTGVIVLSAGENDMTIDAGLKPNNPASVGDKVWNDINGDGVQDVNEPGVPGIIVTLYDAANNVVGTAITDGDGNYLISNVPPGNGYYIIFSNLPATAQFTTQTSDVSTTDATLGSDANTTTGQTASFNLSAGQYLPHVDAGIKNIQLLPIQLISFIAQPQGNNVQLNWVVGVETNIATYQVEYSTTGANYSAIGNTTAIGNRNYAMLHTSPKQGLNYYRLKITDKNGNITYSEVRKVNFGKGGTISIYPNPTSDVVNITLTAAMVNKAATITVLSIDGRVVANKQITAASQTEVMDVSKLASGKYIVRIITEAEVINKQVEVIR